MGDKEFITENGAQHEFPDLPPKITKDNIDPESKTKKGTVLFWIKAILYTMLSALLIAFAARTLIKANGFTIGGASGIAILLDDATKGFLPQSLMSFLLNLPLVILSFFFVKRRFAILTSLNIGFQSLWLFLLEKLLPNFKIIFPGNEASKLFAAVAAGLAIGFAIALAFKVGGSTGGADILAVMIQKKFKATSIAWMLFIINCIVIVSYVVVMKIILYPVPRDDKGHIHYGLLLLPIVLSAFESYIESKTYESITNGFHSAIEFHIITSKPDEMSAAIMKELSRGVTSLPAKGMYTKEDKCMLLCVVSRRQIATLQRIVHEIDPDSFAVMASASQVLGLGFYKSEM